MDHAKTVSVHLVLSHAAHAAAEVFQALRKQTSQDLQIIVVHHATQEWEAPWLAHEGPDFFALRNFRDQGFARAHNQAIALALSRWPKEILAERFVFILSPRTVLAPEALERLVDACRRDPEIALAGPTILRATLLPTEEDRCEIERTTTMESTGTSIKKSRAFFDRGAGEEQGAGPEIEEVFAPPAQGFLIRADALARASVEGEWLDPDLPSAQALFDFLWRCRVLGMRSVHVRDAIAWHQTSVPALLYGTCFLQMKNDTVGDMIRNAPWIIGGWMRGAFTLLFHPRALVTWMRSARAIPRFFRKRRYVHPLFF